LLDNRYSILGLCCSCEQMAGRTCTFSWKLFSSLFRLVLCTLAGHG